MLLDEKGVAQNNMLQKKLALLLKIKECLPETRPHTESSKLLHKLLNTCTTIENIATELKNHKRTGRGLYTRRKQLKTAAKQYIKATDTANRTGRTHDATIKPPKMEAELKRTENQAVPRQNGVIMKKGPDVQSTFFDCVRERK